MLTPTKDRENPDPHNKRDRGQQSQQPNRENSVGEQPKTSREPEKRTLQRRDPRRPSLEGKRIDAPAGGKGDPNDRKNKKRHIQLKAAKGGLSVLHRRRFPMQPYAARSCSVVPITTGRPASGTSILVMPA